MSGSTVGRLFAIPKTSQWLREAGMDNARQYGRDDVDFDTWYTPWMKSIAGNYTRPEIEKKLGVASFASAKAAQSHLRAIQASGSMQGNSSRRASTKNVVAASGEEVIALRGALEIHELFPEKAKSCGR